MSTRARTRTQTAPNHPGPTLHLPALALAPLLSSDLALPSDLFATLAGPLPTITIGTAPCSPSPAATPPPGRTPYSAPASTNAGSALTTTSHLQHPGFAFAQRPARSLSPSPSPRSPCFTPGSGYAPPRGVLDLFELLESMDSDVESEVRRVRRGIQETRMLVRACREDSAARRQKTIEPVRGRQH